MEEVKSERLPLRQRQALQTRREIATAAKRLFVERGYIATSVEAVAEEAGVSPRTVYAAFGNKKAIIGAICDEWLELAGVREAVGRGMATTSLRARLQIVAATSRRQWEVEQGVCALLDGAAASDAEVARMVAGWRTDRATSLRSLFVGVENQLAPGVTADTAGSVLRGLSVFGVYVELVQGEGWSPDRYERWLDQTLVALLLPSSPPS